MTDVTLIVIAKSPRAGLVKTRLCPPCTPDEAARLAGAALCDTLDTVRAVPATAHVIALDGPPGPWIPDGFVIVPQVGHGLDERLGNAFAAVTGPALLIGMDTPHVSLEQLSRAASTLLHPGCDAVLGPAVDGGWWAIGLRRADPRAFLGVPMSTEHTYQDQRERLDELGYHTLVLEEMLDVDTFTDARHVAQLVPSSRFGAAVASLDGAAAPAS